MSRGSRTAWIAPGAHVRVVAPSSPFEADAFLRGVEKLRSRYTVSYDERILERTGYFAGDDARRLAELQGAISDPGVHAIIAARGGYGATRLLPKLYLRSERDKPKLLVGFSDVTALHALWARAGIASLHGPMVATLGNASTALTARYFEALEGRGPAAVSGSVLAGEGAASGVLRGGNLAVLAALLGTPHFPDLHEAVLFLEDTNERPYRVDRMLTSLRNAGVLSGLRGVALGAFNNAEPGPDGVTFADVFRDRLGDLGVPVLSELPAGHVDDNLELPLGTRVTIDCASAELRFDER
ncbi:MAG TPA: LD-carboxypeptidase [Polyangiales bacterium]|jgi:muramoyltetrapeptide carboxypeptidase|nr:LD-carboxypeptidase [Polyangiales bacterium]